jgi:hypothetical protein
VRAGGVAKVIECNTVQGRERGREGWRRDGRTRKEKGKK